MGRLAQFIGLAAVAVAVESFSPARSGEERTPEAAYREYFAARMSLLPTVTEESPLFEALLADPSSGKMIIDMDDLGLRDWNAAEEGSVAEIESLWQGPDAAVLRVVTTPQETGTLRSDGTRLAVLLRQVPVHHGCCTIILPDPRPHGHLYSRSPPAKWQVALDVGTTIAERRILRAKRLDQVASIDSATMQACIAAIRSWIQEEAAGNRKENGWFETEPQLRLILASTAGSLVLADFVSASGESPPDQEKGESSSRGGHFIRDRWLLLAIDSAAGAEKPAIRRIL